MYSTIKYTYGNLEAIVNITLEKSQQSAVEDDFPPCTIIYLLLHEKYAHYCKGAVQFCINHDILLE